MDSMSARGAIETMHDHLGYWARLKDGPRWYGPAVSRAQACEILFNSLDGEKL